MEQLRVRLEQLVAVESHPVRNVEHRTFYRLMYRNRNQHRHGFYFRKLEEVRRVLRKIQQHIAWLSLRNAVTLKPTGKRKASTCIPLPLSSVTHEDLKSLRNLYDHLIRVVTPSAAATVTTELVCRSHFLPFAVTVLSSLARLHVLENKIFQLLQGALVELELLLFVQNPTRQDVPDANCRKEHRNEDLGTEICIPQGQAESFSGALATGQKAIRVTAIQSQPQDHTAHSSLSFPNKRRKLSGKTENPQDSESKSLYQKMSFQESALPLSISFTDRVVSIPQMSSNGTEKPGNTVTNKESSRSGNEHEIGPDSMNRHVSIQQSPRSEIPSDTLYPGNKDKNLRMRFDISANEGANARTNATPALDTDSSDSEDLDDIFGALDD